FTTTPESARERQPLVDVSAHLAITFDGRLDNRAELLPLIDGPVSATIGDAELTLRLYRACGVECVTRLLGDFAFALWDGDARRLVCARDHLGLKPFCYRVAPGRFAWASEVGVLARGPGDVPPPNEGMVAEHIAGIVTSTSDTVFESVYRLPPAHLLVVERGALHLRRYWTPDLRAELRYRTDDEYVEHLRELVHRAVEARLRVAGAVGVSLSGGVDSSSVTGVATLLCRARSVAATHVEAFSLLAPGDLDESAFWNQVVARWNIFSAAIPVTPLSPGLLADEARFFLDVPSSPLAAMTDQLRTAMRARGTRVALTGAGADDWLGTSSWAYADLLKRGRIAALLHRLRHDAASGDFIGWPGAAKSACWPLLPPGAQQLVRTLLRRGRPPSWMNDAFAARVDLRGRLARHTIDLPHDSWERYDTWHEGNSGSSAYQNEVIERASARVGVEMWHPFMDRRIVDFGLALPSAQLWRDGRAKDLLRRAMAPYLPTDVAARATSPGAVDLLFEGFDSQGGRALFTSMRMDRLGWVRQDRLQARYDQARARHRAQDPRFGYMILTLSRVAAIELWARALALET
ncbi:MAG: asparagine synthase-related protein, partial [Gemmatimonadales bacterium]